jgi:NAD(P)-dependent dehydrogenase (short-subunit alcohol dehydrogenase family)
MVDVLYNNAASVHFAPVEELTPKLWTETLKGELDIVFVPTRAAWRYLSNTSELPRTPHRRAASLR